MNNALRWLRNRHVGQTCVIVANGPSLNSTDFGLIRNEICFGLNKIYLGFAKFKFYPRYYVAVNELVLRQSLAEIAGLNCVKFLSRRASELYQPDALTYLINTTDPGPRFSMDISERVEEGWTVTHVALQIAYYMGFKKVVIVGLDHRFEFTGSANEQHMLAGADKNHFSEEYFGYGQQWNNPDLERSEESFLETKAVFEADGREILDATVGGACKIFVKCDLKKALIKS
ncbi:MAG: 6-hydroxymethylpterin diphosphokinase MptE-like protein [Halioglobus sp.]